MDQEQRRLDQQHQDRENERAHIERMRKLELEDQRQREIEATHNDNRNGNGNHADRGCAKAPRLPVFRDDKDDLDAYLGRFERYAEAQHWARESWATNPSALLTGKALDVYYRMNPRQVANYENLKEALLERFLLTEEGFRQRFHGSKAELESRHLSL